LPFILGGNSHLCQVQNVLPLCILFLRNWDTCVLVSLLCSKCSSLQNCTLNGYPNVGYASACETRNHEYVRALKKKIRSCSTCLADWLTPASEKGGFGRNSLFCPFFFWTSYFR
jgi:hypothetical protein